jgi:opacity protein-like surface antigen
LDQRLHEQQLTGAAAGVAAAAAAAAAAARYGAPVAPYYATPGTRPLDVPVSVPDFPNANGYGAGPPGYGAAGSGAAGGAAVGGGTPPLPGGRVVPGGRVERSLSQALQASYQAR